jgi:hypothetical protein
MERAHVNMIGKYDTSGVCHHCGEVSFLNSFSRVFLLRQIWIVKYYVNCSVKKFVWIYEFPDGFFLTTSYISIFYTVLVLI